MVDNYLEYDSFFNAGRCLGCKNQGDPELRHPASGNVYAGGHEDCAFPFLIDSDSEVFSIQ